MSPTNYPATFVVGGPEPGPSTSSPGRKRGRCDSLPQEHRPPGKMSKGYDDTDTDTEMEGLLCSPSGSLSTLSLPIIAATTPVLQKSSKRDESYYFEDGSCVLLVDDTLFNVSFFFFFFFFLELFVTNFLGASLNFEQRFFELQHHVLSASRRQRGRGAVRQ